MNRYTVMVLPRLNDGALTERFFNTPDFGDYLITLPSWVEIDVDSHMSHDVHEMRTFLAPDQRSANWFAAYLAERMPTFDVYVSKIECIHAAVKPDISVREVTDKGMFPV